MNCVFLLAEIILEWCVSVAAIVGRKFVLGRMWVANSVEGFVLFFKWQCRWLKSCSS